MLSSRSMGCFSSPPQIPAVAVGFCIGPLEQPIAIRNHVIVIILGFFTVKYDIFFLLVKCIHFRRILVQQTEHTHIQTSANVFELPVQYLKQSV